MKLREDSSSGTMGEIRPLQFRVALTKNPHDLHVFIYLSKGKIVYGIECGVLRIKMGMKCYKIFSQSLPSRKMEIKTILMFNFPQ